MTNTSPPTVRPSRRAWLLTVAVLTVLAVLAVGVASWYLLTQRDGTAPVALPAPTTATTTPDESPEPGPTPTPTPSETPVPETPPIVGLTTAGELVEIDPTTGATLRTIGVDPAWTGALSLTPDRTAVYLHREGEPLYEELLRVSLADGSATVVARGRNPSVSPDGRRLAYVGDNPANPDDEWRALHVLDLQSGDLTVIPDNSCGGCPRRIDQPAWTPDGTRLYVAIGFQDSAVPGLDLVVVTPGVTPELDTAPVFQPADTNPNDSPGFPTFLPDGTLAVISVINYGTGDAGDGLSLYVGAVETFDTATATVLGSEQFAELHSVAPDEVEMTRTSGAAASSQSNALAIVAQDWTDPAGPTYTLYRWDELDGLREIAEGIVAVAW